MKGLGIFIHSVKQVFGNFGAAIRISAVLYLVQIGVALALGQSLTSADASQYAEMAQTGNFPVVQLLVTLIIALVTSLWIAVAWHRYVLLNEEPGSVVPAFRGDRILGYFGYSILIALIMVVLGAIIGMVAGLVLGPLLLSNGPTLVGLLLIGLVVYVPLLVIGYRLSVALPASALGAPLGLGGAWERTKGATGTLLVLGVISVVAAFLLDAPATYVFVPGSVPAIIWSALTQWVFVMVGVSILTTLYGHYVEDRALNA